jgi:NADH-quinone oxidoreductase subunit C
MGEAKTTFIGKAAVLEGLPEHPAVKAILAWKPEALTDASSTAMS